MIFDVTPEEANLIGAALSEMPYKISAKLLEKLSSQAAEQQKPPEQQVSEQPTT